MSHEKIIRKINGIEEALLSAAEMLSPDISFLGCKSVGALLFLIKNTYSLELIENNEDVIRGLINSFIINMQKVAKEGVFSFGDGLMGYGWLLTLLMKTIDMDIEAGLFLKKLDRCARDYSIGCLKKNNYDFLHGAIGAGVYMIERIDKNDTLSSLEIIVRLLKESSVPTNTGISWSSPALSGKCNSFDLGLAHGIPGIIAFLSMLMRLELKRFNNAQDLIRGSVDFILSNENPNPQLFGFFPHQVSPGNGKPSKSRLAWCYGDLGIAVALWLAGETLFDSSLKEKAIDICLKTTERKCYKETRIIDAGICHGSSGVAHIYNRMYYYTDLKEFKDAANFWIEKTIEIGCFDDGIAGFKTWNSPDYGGWQAEYGLLDGVAGIGLALSSHLSEKEPTWDRFLLLS